jgi:hypothetical protein
MGDVSFRELSDGPLTHRSPEAIEHSTTFSQDPLSFRRAHAGINLLFLLFSGNLLYGVT